MSLKNKKLVAVLSGRPYLDNLTLRRFLIPPIRKMLENENIDIIIATNNKKAAEQYRKMNNIKLVETSEQLHNEFMARQREIKPNLGAETRETINQYAIKNGYKYALHLDDNITSIFYRHNGKNKTIVKYKALSFYDIIILLFQMLEKTNSGAVGIEMSAFKSDTNNIRITAGFPYSFFAHRVDENFKFENSTEDDILMSIYNGNNNKPSCVIRNAFYYGKTGKKSSMDGNRKIYQSMLKENKRGEYAEKMYPNIYKRRVSYMVKSSTNQKEPFLQHKHTLTKPKKWDKTLVIDEEAFKIVKNTLRKVTKRENYEN